MKPFVLFLPVFFICILFVFVLPHLIRFSWVRVENLPVGVTALGSSASTLDAPFYAGSDTSDNRAVNGYAGLNDFIERIANGQPGQIVGVFAPDVFALPVQQQPTGQPDYVDRENNMLTEFSLPRKYGSTGLLAHNYLSGSYFSQLKKNQDVVLVFGDGRLEHYRVSGTVSFQALKPNSPFSNFIDLAHPNSAMLTSADLFNRIYTTQNQLVFQTCIEANGEPSWGRMFIIASLIEPIRLNVPALNTIRNSN